MRSGDSGRPVTKWEEAVVAPSVRSAGPSESRAMDSQREQNGSDGDGLSRTGVGQRTSGGFLGEVTLASDRAYDAIRDLIVSAEYKPGDRLREGDLGERIGVSRTPIREALRRLVAEGLIDFLPNRGAFVASWDDDDLIDIFEIRSVLEGFACNRAASRIEQPEIDRLEELADAMEARYRGTAIEHFHIALLNNEFHHVLLAASRSRLLTTTVEGVLRVALIHRTFLRFSDRDMQRSFHHHREIIDAVRSGDGEWAESVMRSHIRAARDIILNSRSNTPHGSADG